MGESSIGRSLVGRSAGPFMIVPFVGRSVVLSIFRCLFSVRRGLVFKWMTGLPVLRGSREGAAGMAAERV